MKKKMQKFLDERERRFEQALKKQRDKHEKKDKWQDKKPKS
jgi:hypothetical protein